jgi:hypothetical protein
MTDTILRTRVEELRRTLWRAGLPQFESDVPAAAQTQVARDQWRENRTRLELERLGRISKGVWRYLDRSFSNAARDLDDELLSLMEDLDDASTPVEPETAWLRYQQLYNRCQALFAEFVELAGGLAFLDRSGDPWVFKVADYLVQTAVMHTREDWFPLTVPQVQDTVARTMAQILRLPFPDWTVWALPLSIVEFAHVYLAEGSRDRAPGEPRTTPQRILSTIVSGLPSDAPLSGRNRELMADVFATSHLGPSYAIAALRLRLDPEDADRAHVILYTLSQLGRENQDRPGPYERDVVEPLRAEWEAARTPQRPLSDEARRSLDQLVDLCLSAYRRSIPLLEYRTELHHGAQAILLAWKQLQERSIHEGELDLTQAQTARVDDLREVLNVVWLARLEGVAADDTIAAAGEALCLSALEPDEASPGGSLLGLQVGRQTLSGGPRTQRPSHSAQVR